MPLGCYGIPRNDDFMNSLSQFLLDDFVMHVLHARRQKSMKGGSTREASRAPRVARCFYGRGIWCKILHSSDLETPNFSLKKFHFSLPISLFPIKCSLKTSFFHNFFSSKNKSNLPTYMYSYFQGIFSIKYFDLQ